MTRYLGKPGEFLEEIMPIYDASQKYQQQGIPLMLQMAVEEISLVHHLASTPSRVFRTRTTRMDVADATVALWRPASGSCA